MTKYAWVATLLLSLSSALAAAAEGPEGEWLVKDRTAHIRIKACGQKLWGVVSWLKTPGIDDHNPDPARHNDPILGLPILLAMQPGKPDRWDGHIYDAQNGKTYSGSIILKEPDTLRVQGCILKFLCGGESWKRIEPEKDFTENICKRVTR